MATDKIMTTNPSVIPAKANLTILLESTCEFSPCEKILLAIKSSVFTFWSLQLLAIQPCG